MVNYLPSIKPAMYASEEGDFQKVLRGLEQAPLWTEKIGTGSSLLCRSTHTTYVRSANPSSLPTQEYHWFHQGRPRPRAWYYYDHPCLGVSALVGIPCPLMYTNGFLVVGLFVSF